MSRKGPHSEKKSDSMGWSGDIATQHYKADWRVVQIILNTHLLGRQSEEGQEQKSKLQSSSRHFSPSEISYVVKYPMVTIFFICNDQRFRCTGQTRFFAAKYPTVTIFTIVTIGDFAAWDRPGFLAFFWQETAHCNLSTCNEAGRQYK